MQSRVLGSIRKTIRSPSGHGFVPRTGSAVSEVTAGPTQRPLPGAGISSGLGPRDNRLVADGDRRAGPGCSSCGSSARHAELVGNRSDGPARLDGVQDRAPEHAVGYLLGTMTSLRSTCPRITYPRVTYPTAKTRGRPPAQYPGGSPIDNVPGRLIFLPPAHRCRSCCALSIAATKCSVISSMSPTAVATSTASSRVAMNRGNWKRPAEAESEPEH